MKLTKSLRAVIVKQFKAGEDMEYLAKLYGFTLDRIEQIVRLAMIEIDERIGKIGQAKPDGKESYGSDS